MLTAYFYGQMSSLLVFIVIVLLVTSVLQWRSPRVATQPIQQIDVVELSVQRGNVRRMIDAYRQSGYNAIEVTDSRYGNHVKVLLTKSLPRPERQGYWAAGFGAVRS